jgi:aryl-alcohol dehydrogenase-like predicted oxidoreductase
MTPVEETVAVMQDLQKAGKVRFFGLSNETPWGAMTFLSHEPRVVSIQNPYSLLNRIYDIGMSEVSMREGCGLLAYSPLAFGALSGKYLGGLKPEGARMTMWSRFSRYNSEKAQLATERYVALAHEFGLDPAQMALAFVNGRPFVTANIIGATTLPQLESNIDAHAIILPKELLSAIDKVHDDIPNPCP